MKSAERTTPAPRSRTGAARTKAASHRARPEIWSLKLYVAGLDRGASVALSNLKEICEQHLAGHYRIEVIDLVRHPQLARGEQIFAVPTLVRRLPSPIRKIIGDLSDTHRVLVGLDLAPRAVGNLGT